MRTFNVGCIISNRIEFGSCELANPEQQMPAASDLPENDNPDAGQPESPPDNPE
jgi:hypothetical protein